MDELIDIWSADGKPTGKSVLKSEAHRLGLYHPTVHLWCYSSSGKVLLQQRGKDKKSFPLKWDVSVAGHVASSESIEIAALREAKEEIGVLIKVESLEKLTVFRTEHRHAEDFIDREFNHTFLYELDLNTELMAQEEEVESLKWITLENFEKMLSDPSDLMVPNINGRYQKVIAAIRSRMQKI